VDAAVDLDDDAELGEVEVDLEAVEVVVGLGVAAGPEDFEDVVFEAAAGRAGTVGEFALRRATPRRPRLSAAKAWRRAWLVSLSTCAWRTMRRYALSLRMVDAQSRIVCSGAATGMWSTKRQAKPLARWCGVTPSLGARLVGVVTWMSSRGYLSRPYSSCIHPPCHCVLVPTHRPKLRERDLPMLPGTPSRQLLIWSNRKNIAHSATFFRFGGFGLPHPANGGARQVTELDAPATKLRQVSDE
jgi:hypothetical protein